MHIEQDSAHRVNLSTDPSVNDRIQQDMERRIAYFAAHPDRINARLETLDQEWDIERTLEGNAATLAFTGGILSLLGGKKWLLLSLVVNGFLLQHAVQGYCPPLTVLRRLGFRTMREIDEERFALKVLRGDFRDLPDVADSENSELNQVVEAVRQ